MKDYVIITDSSCDLTPALAAETQIEVIPLQLTMEGKEYKNYLDGREIDSKAFYAKLREGVTASTSAVNPDVFSEAFK